MFFKLCKTAAKTHQIMQKFYGHKCLSRPIIYEWFKRFKEVREDLIRSVPDFLKSLRSGSSGGRIRPTRHGTCLNDDERSGRPRSFQKAKNDILTISHSPYSPDSAPCDFYLYGKLHLAMKRKRYADIKDIQRSMTAILNIISTNEIKIFKMKEKYTFF